MTFKRFPGIAEAFWYASQNSEPAFVPVTMFVDDRGWSMMNMLKAVMSEEGQINFSYMHPDVIKAWHRHQLQTDFWITTVGHLKVGVYRDDGTLWSEVIGERKPGMLVIPPNLWHGAATVGTEGVGLLYYVTHAYNASQPDEERRPYDSVEGMSWTTVFH